jgi:hypothetical protein
LKKCLYFKKILGLTIQQHHEDHEVLPGQHEQGNGHHRVEDINLEDLEQEPKLHLEDQLQGGDNIVYIYGTNPETSHPDPELISSASSSSSTPSLPSFSSSTTVYKAVHPSYSIATYRIVQDGMIFNLIANLKFLKF